MALHIRRMESKKRLLLRDVNPALLCILCEGYLVDATVLVDCLHVFCRGCIIKYFENCKTACPKCNIIYKKKHQTCFRPDPQLQSLVYKLVPGLYAKEMQKREDFYRSTGVRASSSCSDDSVLERERETLNDQEEWIASCVGDRTQFFSPEDSISLSLEYYQAHLDTTNSEEKRTVEVTPPKLSITDDLKSDKCNSDNSKHKINGVKSASDNDNTGDKDSSDSRTTHRGDKRYLQCPAAVSMQHLQKFLRMKYGLTLDHRVDIIYEGEVLPLYFSLMDVAYTFKWKRTKPMRFFYRIFTPMKIRPIKIINTTSSTGGKQLQIVQLKTTSSESQKSDKSEPSEKSEKKDESNDKPSEKENEEKEELMAHLQLQSKHKVKVKKNPEKSPECVYEYEEPDKEEIKKFAEKRDREWAMQKKLDEEEHTHVSKKRKKSKHSKNESMHKKRKLHAEITSNEEEDLKLKVKITPHNGHKHKHHKNYVEKEREREMSSKEKLLQMRQVRHKHVSSEDKNVQTINSVEKKKEVTFAEAATTTDKIIEQKPIIKNVEQKITIKNIDQNLTAKKVEQKQFIKSDHAPAVKNDIIKIASVQIERNEATEKQAQKTFLKTIQSNADKINKIETAKIFNKNNTLTQKQLSSLERKINNLQQQCTVESRPVNVQKSSENTKIHGEFTVSKIEAGVKRKAEDGHAVPDKRPSLEITLINPPTSSPKPSTSPQQQNVQKAQQKRPPPPTIPLERIRKSINLKSGISIIPKQPDVCDNIGALDLSSKQTKSSEAQSVEKLPNGLTRTSSSTIPTSKPNQLSNLQMLSKVATEHPNLKSQPSATSAAKPRSQIPNLQTLKIPSPLGMKPPNPNNLAKLPKLNEINRTQFRMSNPQIRNLRPNQNQNIRNIPNPSLLIRQQNQNRLNTFNSLNSMNAVSSVASSVADKVSMIEKKEISV